MLPRLLLACAIGILVSFAFPVYTLTPLVFVALVPLVVAVWGARRGRALLLGWVRRHDEPPRGLLLGAADNRPLRADLAGCGAAVLWFGDSAEPYMR
jgi:hypothetical protein